MQVYHNDVSEYNDYVLNNIYWLQQNTTGIEFVAIAIPYHDETPFCSIPGPGPTTTHASVQHIQPRRSPYLCHWDVNNNEVWYKMDWNHHITLRCGLLLYFNDVLTVLADL